MSVRTRPDLEELANLYGLQTSYTDGLGRERVASAEAILAVLRALGAPVDGLADVPAALRERREAPWRRVCEPVVVAWDESPPMLELRLPAPSAAATVAGHLAMESGQKETWSWKCADLPTREEARVGRAKYARLELPLPRGLPPGYHRLTLEADGKLAETLVISAPSRCYVPAGSGPRGDKAWGVFLPLYALSSARSWGKVGNLSDLASLMEWVAGLGGGVVATLPLLAGFYERPFDPSPYSPASRLFWNELYLDVEAVPELETCRDAQALVSSRAWRRREQLQRETPLIDYREQMRLRREVLELLARSLSEGSPENSTRRASFEQFVRSHPAVDDYARFRAAGERLGVPWSGWPPPLSDGLVREKDFDEEARRYHLYVQWLLHEQLEALGAKARASGVMLYLDLALGVHPDGYDVWRERNAFALGLSAGAPPDALFQQGQDWGFPPLHPERIRDQGYRYVIASLQHHLRRANMLRLDHVMGLHRMFTIPRGMRAVDGLYVHFAAEELYAILCLESQRHQALIVGEDLGTVPPEVRPAMARHGLQRLSVLQYELDPQPDRPFRPVPADAVAGLNTHDMPPFAAFWQGMDLDIWRELGFFDEAEFTRERAHRQALKEALVRSLEKKKRIPRRSDRRDILRACLAHASASHARIALVNLEDLWGETEPHNVPGTRDERPNWRRRARFALEEFRQRPEVLDTLGEVNRQRSRSGGDDVRYDVSFLTDDDLYLFNEGSHLHLYEKLGSHPLRVEGTEGTYFAVWAPNAVEVSVIGDFNGWAKGRHCLRSRASSGIWEGFLPGVADGAIYKFHIVSRHRSYRVDKADPFGLRQETPPLTASQVHALDYRWGDEEWMASRGERSALNAPISVYEVHLGSWRRVPEEGHRSLTYREMAEHLPAYVARMGFTHVEFLPVMEHPFYGSWGYQSTGYFAPTGRFGSPEDFMFLVDRLHQRGIGVILDWVPSHFPGDEHGLAYFDGTYLFEHADPRKGFHPDWKSAIFNYGRNEVRSFLLSSALFWLDKYHADGLRVDAVASMLYLDYSRKEGEWIPNRYGGRENLEAIDFLRRLNTEAYGRFPGVQMIAEESTAWPMVTRPTYVGGLGFGFKWDMGWMHDTLVYMSKDPVHRKYHHNELTFRMLYAFTENFILPLSHDEVVHGKRSLLDTMSGDLWQKFANLRLLFGYMYAQPGKKCLFMGAEIGQWEEWSHEGSVSWHLLAYPPHQGIQKLVEDLNRLYRSEPALHRLDCHGMGFEWVDCDDSDSSVLSFLRKGDSPETVILAACNFTPVPRTGYRVGVPWGGRWREILNSDAAEYGGSGLGNAGGVQATGASWHGRPDSLTITLPPLAIVLLKSERS